MSELSKFDVANIKRLESCMKPVQNKIELILTSI
jgi:hypothetical protein